MANTLQSETGKKSEELKPAELKQRKSLIEAALYVAGYPLEFKTLCSVCHTHSKRLIQSIARQLADEYKARNGALEIIELEDGRFVMQLKSQYVHRVRRLSIKPLLTDGPLKTLSYIAYRQPVPQAKIILVRGDQAYQHISRLLEMGLVTREKFGKSHLVRTTERFADYFSLSKEQRLFKRQLDTLFAQAGDLDKEPIGMEESSSEQS